MLPRAFIRRRFIITGFAIAVATGVLAFVFHAAHSRSSFPGASGSPRPELQELIAAVGTRRPFEPRLTGNFAYGLLNQEVPTRSAAPAPTEAPLSVRAAAIALEKRAHESTDPLAVNAFGVAQLVIGRSAAAVAALERASRLAPADARLASDMAAGYLVRARETDRIEDVARAIGFAQQATGLDPQLAEARFNLALSLEGLSLRHEAARAWQSYVELDDGSPWAREARSRLERLAETPEARWEKQRREIIAAADRGDDASIRAATLRYPDTAYEYVENDLIPAWADAWVARDVPLAAKHVRLARAFGQALADGVSERMPLDAAIAIERASRNTERANALARGHQIFRDARALYDQDRIAEATGAFEKAGRELARGESPFVAWARLHTAISLYYRSEFDRSLAILNEIATRTGAFHLRLDARAQWMIGLIHAVRGHVADSLEAYQRALTAFEKVGAAADSASMHSSIADILEAVGDLNAVWAHKRDSLARLPTVRIPRRRETILAAAAKVARRANFLPAAVSLQTELITDAQRVGLAGAVVQGFLDRAEVRGLTGDDKLAAGDVAQAQQWLTRIPDEALEKRLRAETLLAEGQTLILAQPLRAIDTLRRSLEYFRKSGIEVRVPRVNLAIGRAQLHAGQIGAAEQTFLEGIRALEAQRARLPRGQLRLGYFEQPWNLFEEMVKLQVTNAGNLQKGILYAERFRARDLAEMSAGSDSSPVVDPATLAERLPADTAVLYYVLLEDRLLVGVVRRGKVDFIQERVTARALDEEVTSYLALLERGERGSTDRGSARLYDRLVRPALPLLVKSDVLVVVPDGILNAVPFAALKNQQTGRYLIEEHAVHVAPSATMLDRTSARLRQANTVDDVNVLVFANPRLAAADAKTLPDLSHTEAEARDIAALYANATVLSGAHATKRAFVERAPGHRIVHFAGHALANDRYALLSRLLLAPDGSDDAGSLFAHEILDLKLSSTDLVVLAACRTGTGAIRKGEGAISLARPFLAAGVPSVVASLWDVKDDASRALFAAFYQSLRGGAAPVAALRDAQLQLLRDSDPGLQSPAAWGAFISLGGVRSNGGM